MNFLQNLIQFLQRSKKTILLIIIVSAATLLISTMVSIWLNRFHNLRFPSLGTIQITGVRAYGGNISITQDGNQFLDWGIVFPGAFVNRSFFIENNGTTSVTLNLTISNVTFQNSTDQNIMAPFTKDPLTLTWDYDNAPLDPNAEIYVTLTLQISDDPPFINFLVENRVTNFSFDIIIKPVEQ